MSNRVDITVHDKFMDSLTDVLYRTIAPNGCMLLRINPRREIVDMNSRGLSGSQETALLGKLSGLELPAQKTAHSDKIEVLKTKYDITYISGLSDIQGMLITPSAAEGTPAVARDGVWESLSFYLLGMVMHQFNLRDMSIFDIAGEEENRIAGEIHDTVIQKLFAITCSLRVMGEGKDDISRDQIKHISKAVESTMRELREIIYGQRWHFNKQETFSDKLILYMDEMKILSDASINLAIDIDERIMSENQKTTLFRIICEATNNAIRHGEATRVDILVKQDDEQLIAEIGDNGKGFDWGQISTGGQGIKNMYKTAGLLNGHVSIESEIDKGTVFRCTLPKNILCC